MKKLSMAVLALSFALPVLAQTPDPQSPDPVPQPTPAPGTPAPAPPPPEKPKSSGPQRWFFGGGVGASFGDVDYVEIAPLVGVKVLPRFDLGLQPFYRWIDDGRYSPSITTNDYGATLFARVRVFAGFFVEGDYQYTSYEYPNVGGGTTRDTYNAFLAGGGYSIPVGGHVGVYVSALYDFSYDGNDVNRPYDSPVRVQVGVAVGF
jgi:hypothetical protein